MREFPKKLKLKLIDRSQSNSLRQLGVQNSLVDFSSNDYLGFSKSEDVFNKSHQYLIDNHIQKNGSTGSRLLSGNYKLYNEVETMLCKFHNTEAALVFNSGYDANIGFFSSVPQRGDLILYDEYIHASIRDGIKLSNAQAFKFKHNDLDDLQAVVNRSRNDNADTYIVTESVFSMDGDSPDLMALAQMSEHHHAFLIVDEAHAVGVFGQGKGLIQELGLEDQIFARLVTFGKGLGCHGATILGNHRLKQYLVNFARSFIYTTALPLHALATVKVAYGQLVISNEGEKSHYLIQKLKHNIQYFKFETERLKLEDRFRESDSAIHSCIVSGNNKVKAIAKKLQEQGFDVKPILSPTIPKGQERLRFCLHSFNKKEDISSVLKILKKDIT